MSEKKSISILLEEAKAAVAAMSPEERGAMWQAQRESWTRGEKAMGESSVVAKAHAPSGEMRNTHLLDWLADGYTHCSYGTKEWCERYLNNARAVIIAQDRTLSTAVALVDKHINAAVRCKDEALYEKGVPIGIVIQDMRELRESIAALDEKIEPWVPEPPAGWFLLRAAHEHTPIIFNGDTHKPQPHVEGPWVVEFQRLPHGGWLTEGRGRTFGEAWERACVAVERRTAA